eukprot:8432356-Pyramimonas_sp.AAC.1
MVSEVVLEAGPISDHPVQAVEDHSCVFKQAARRLMRRLEMRAASSPPEFLSWTLAALRGMRAVGSSSFPFGHGQDILGRACAAYPTLARLLDPHEG